MMDWNDFLTEVTLQPEPEVILMATATSGLHTGDSILAVSYRHLRSGEEIEHGTIFNLVPDDILLPSQEYHKIAPDFMRSHGLPTEEFTQKLAAILAPGRTVFTYNSNFQIKAITLMHGGFPELLCFICDLPVWLQAAESKMVFAAKKPPIDRIEHEVLRKIIKAVPTWKRLLEARHLSSTPPPGKLPVVYNVECLLTLYRAMEKEPPDILLEQK